MVEDEVDEFRLYDDGMIRFRMYTEAVSSFNVRIVIYMQCDAVYDDRRIKDKKNTGNELMDYITDTLA